MTLSGGITSYMMTHGGVLQNRWVLVLLDMERPQIKGEKQTPYTVGRGVESGSYCRQREQG